MPYNIHFWSIQWAAAKINCRILLVFYRVLKLSEIELVVQTIHFSSVAQFESSVACVVDLLLLFFFCPEHACVSEQHLGLCMLHNKSTKRVIPNRGVGCTFRSRSQLLAKRHAYGIDKVLWMRVCF